MTNFEKKRIESLKKKMTPSLKPMQTRGFREKFNPFETLSYINWVNKFWKNPKTNCDLYVFKTQNGIMEVSINGYDLQNNYIEKRTIYKTDSLPTDTFWCKINRDENDEYIALFMFPEEY